MRDKIVKFCEKVLLNISFKDICFISLICFLSMEGIDKSSHIVSCIAYIVYVLSCTALFLFSFSLSVAIYMDLTKHNKHNKHTR